MFDHSDLPGQRRLMRRKADQLIRRHDFRNQDRDDVEQELFLKLWKNRDRYDPARGSAPAYVKTVVERETASIARREQTQKRDPNRSRSLEEFVATCDGPVELGTTLPESQSRKHLGGAARRPQAEVERRCDIEEVLRTLPAELRELADRLTRDTPAQVARDKNVPRTSLVHKLRELRRPFERAKLDEYL